MKCEEFIDRLVSAADEEITPEMKEHLAGCEDCAAYYAVISELTPKNHPQTPESLKAGVLKKAGRKKIVAIKNKYSRIAASVAAVAAIGAGIVFFGNTTPARAAHRIIDKSLSGIGKVRSMVMTLDVRTGLKENFSYIDIDGDMVGHTLTVLRSDRPKWRLDKGWRCIVFDGTSKYMWSPDNLINVKGSANADFEGWFAVLTDPEMILLKEKLALRDGYTDYSVTESGDEIILTADVRAKGDFSNPYLLNTSIGESDTRREIVFDKQTGLIKRMAVYVKDSSREVLMVNITDIDYNILVDESWLAGIPADREWRDVSAEPGVVFAGIEPEEAARILFRAFGDNDRESAREALIQYDQNNLFQTYGGIKLIRLGKPFRSGEYAGLFIPYEIRMPGGKIKRHNLALRNDNRSGAWVVDGGI